jgi:hypothetical protein
MLYGLLLLSLNTLDTHMSPTRVRGRVQLHERIVDTWIKAISYSIIHQIHLLSLSLDLCVLCMNW